MNGAEAGPRPALASHHWLVAERVDFWIVSAGAGALLVVTALVLFWLGDRELSAADLILGELHLGATYEAIARRRLWRRMPFDVVVVPLAILIGTYVLLLNDDALLVTTTILYFGAWHRGRQNLGIAQYYQRHAGGPVSPPHRWLLATSFYLPMIAAVAYYASIAPDHEGDAFHGLSLAPEPLWWLVSGAAASVIAYLAWTVGRAAVPGDRSRQAIGHAGAVVHPCERWLVLANALGFGSAYVLGAWTSSLVLALAIHHEVQYLYFTYAVARRAEASTGPGAVSEMRRLARFALWPAIGLASWVICKISSLGALEPFLIAGLLGHYWLDGRIWTARARNR
jgi:hypothetical protein